jgi:hypothetical protein
MHDGLLAFIINMLFIPSMVQAILGGSAGLKSTAPVVKKNWQSAPVPHLGFETGN